MPDLPSLPKFERLVVFCPNLIGDTVMATPFLRALRETYPTSRITAVVKPQVAPVLEGAPWLDDRILYVRGARSRQHRMIPAIRALRKEHAQVAFLLTNSFRSAMMTWMAAIPRRIGYSRGGRSLLLTDRVEPLRNSSGGFLPVPAVEYYLALARKIGAHPRSPRTELFTSENDERAADNAWSVLGLPPSTPVVCLNTGGAFGPAKNWPIEHFVRLAKELVRQTDCRVLVLCGPGERENALAIEASADHPHVRSLSELPLSIGLSKACVKRACLLVTTDSGPRHFAGAFGTPVVSLFGPTHIGWTRTYHPNAIHLQQPVECGPCQQPVCPQKHHRCMKELDPETVLRASLKLLEPVAFGPLARVG